MSCWLPRRHGATEKTWSQFSYSFSFSSWLCVSVVKSSYVYITFRSPFTIRPTVKAFSPARSNTV
jgi:hypothetical protein